MRCARCSASSGRPTGVSGAVGAGAGSEALADVRAAVARTGEELGERLRVLVGKPGLDGHSNGAEQVAVRARDAGFEVVYQGIRLTPEQIVAAAVAEDVHLVGISILSGSHMELVPEVLDRMRDAGAGDVPVIVGGIIPEADAVRLKELGVAEVFTPKDFGLNDIMARFVDVIRASRGLPADVARPPGLTRARRVACPHGPALRRDAAARPRRNRRRTTSASRARGWPTRCPREPTSSTACSRLADQLRGERVAVPMRPDQLRALLEHLGRVAPPGARDGPAAPGGRRRRVGAARPGT